MKKILMALVFVGFVSCGGCISKEIKVPVSELYIVIVDPVTFCAIAIEDCKEFGAVQTTSFCVKDDKKLYTAQIPVRVFSDRKRAVDFYTKRMCRRENEIEGENGTRKSLISYERNL